MGIEICVCYSTRAARLGGCVYCGKEFLAGEGVCLILGDNIFFGHGLPELLRIGAKVSDGALVFAYPVKDPERYGVVEVDADSKAISLEEKPAHPRSTLAVPGIYFYDSRVVNLAEGLKPSPRGEIEITDLNKCYLNEGKLKVQVLGRGIAWLDAGTHESLLQAANFVQAVEDRQGMMISCVEEIAYRMGYIDSEKLHQLASSMSSNSYGAYLLSLVEG